MYLTYDEYTNLGGTLELPAFTSLELQAEVKIDYYTFRRLQNDTEYSNRIKLCIMKIIEYLNIYKDYYDKTTNLNNPVVSSQSNDGVSISYGGLLGNTSPADMQSVSEKKDMDIYNTIKQYLADEKNQAGQLLLYRGVYR